MTDNKKRKKRTHHQERSNHSLSNRRLFALALVNRISISTVFHSSVIQGFW